jgi:4-hydroxy-2-oxoheptanedioate aldolase
VLGVTETERTAARGFASDSRGVWCQDATPAAAARLARAGFDWLAIDLQHGRHGRSELIDIARGLPADAAPLVVRVPSSEFTGIGLALDVGARAVIVPQIESAEQASAAVDATFYPPKGRRSSGQMQRIWGAPELTESAANEQIVCAVMIESATALDLVDEIAAVPGLGGLFVGPYDLSLGIGTRVPDLLADTSSDSPLRRIAKAAADHGLLVGAFAGNPAHARLFADHGITCIAVATDGWILQTGAAAALAAEATA